MGFLVPTISVTSLSHKILIFLFANNLFCKTFSALRVFLLWISITLLANLVRNKASSTAVFPPPTTATILFLKKKASQVAQAETPNPV